MNQSNNSPSRAGAEVHFGNRSVLEYPSPPRTPILTPDTSALSLPQECHTTTHTFQLHHASLSLSKMPRVIKPMKKAVKPAPAEVEESTKNNALTSVEKAAADAGESSEKKTPVRKRKPFQAFNAPKNKKTKDMYVVSCTFKLTLQHSCVFCDVANPLQYSAKPERLPPPSTFSRASR